MPDRRNEVIYRRTEKRRIFIFRWSYAEHSSRSSSHNPGHLQECFGISSFFFRLAEGRALQQGEDDLDPLHGPISSQLH